MSIAQALGGTGGILMLGVIVMAILSDDWGESDEETARAKKWGKRAGGLFVLCLAIFISTIWFAVVVK